MGSGEEYLSPLVFYIFFYQTKGVMEQFIEFFYKQISGIF